MRRWLRHMLIFMAWGLGWFALWTISFYLTRNGQQAALLLPQGVYLAMLILLGRRFWPALILPELLMIGWLLLQQLISESLMLISPLISLITVVIVRPFWPRFPLYWQRLSLLIY